MPQEVTQVGHSPRQRKIVRRAALGAGLALLAACLTYVLGANYVLNRIYKPKLEKVFSAGNPDSSLHIGHLTFQAWDNRLVFDSIALSNSSSGWNCQVAAVSFAGIRWMELFKSKPPIGQLLAHSLVDATNLQIAFHKSQYQLRCRSFQTSFSKNSMVAENVEWRPTVSDEQFFAARDYRRTRFQWSIPRCEITGVNATGLVEGKGLQAKLIKVENPVLETLMDREKPINPHPKRPLMPVEALALLPQPVRVDKVAFINGRIASGARLGNSLGPGVLTFEAVQLGAEGIVSDSQTNPPVQLRGEAKFMNAGTLKLALQLPLTSRELPARYSGSLTAMDLTPLNPFLGVVGHNRIKTGFVREASFQSAIKGDHAVGELKGLYESLEVVFLDRKTGKEGGLLNRVKSIVTDRLVLRTVNLPDKAGFAAVGKIDYTRKTEEKYLHFLWFTIRSGIVDLLGISDYVKAAN